MILVTGATGTVGREVARAVAAEQPVRLLVRQPDRVSVTGAGVEPVAGDYSSPESLRRALRGVRAAFLVTNRPDQPHDESFLAAARAEGVQHIVKLSAAAVEDEQADDVLTCWQRRTEEQLRASGLGWTLLRPRSFMSNTLSWAPAVRSERLVRALYGASGNACVDPRDVAAVAAVALTRSGHEGMSHVLTGPQPISAIEQTAVLAEVLGTPLRFEELDEAQARAVLLERQSPAVAEALLRSAARQQAGAKRRVTDTVAAVTGVPARSYRTWAQDHAGAFA